MSDGVKRSERVFIDTGEVVVTDRRVVFHDVTFSLWNITSVREEIVMPNRLVALTLLSLGALLALAGATGAERLSDEQASTGLVIGLALAAIAVAWLVLQRTWFQAVIHTAGGEREAYRSEDPDRTEEVATAIKMALVAWPDGATPAMRPRSTPKEG